jgi:peptide/nickel transport system substrate-binding protein
LAAPPPEGEDIRFAESFDFVIGNIAIPVINPMSPAVTTPTNWVHTMIYDRLVESNWDTGEIIPSLASSWDTEGYQSFTFYLRDDVYFHNGDKFTAQDVADTVSLGQNAVGSRAMDVWRQVVNVDIINEYTIRLELGDPNVYFFSNLITPQASIVNRRTIEADPETGTWIGTGAYIVTGFATSDYVNFVRNDDYWGKPPMTRYQNWRFVPEVSTRAIIMQNGEACAAGGVGVEDLRGFQANPENFIVGGFPLNNPFGLMFNMEDPIAGDINFRKAVVYAMNREEIAFFAAGEWAMPEVTGTYWGFGTEFRNDNIPVIPFDLDKAREYLAASVYNGEEIELLSSTQPAFSRGAEAITEQLNRLGINATLTLMDPASLIAATTWENNRARMIFFEGMFTFSSGSAREIFYPGFTQNRARYNNPVVNEMFDLVRTVEDRNERREIYMQIQEIIAEDMPMVNMIWRNSPVVTVTGIGGMLRFADMPMDDYRFVYRILD